MNAPASLLTDAERCLLTEPVRLNVGHYHTWNPARPCEFVADLDARPLGQLADDAADGRRVYEFMSIQRPGDVLHYFWITFVDVDHEIADDVRQAQQNFRRDLPLRDLSLIEFDNHFRCGGDDTRPFEQEWLCHRSGTFWQEQTNILLQLVKGLQSRLCERDDYLLQRELRQIDVEHHRCSYLATIHRDPRLISIIDEIVTEPLPADLINEIMDLLKRDDVRSVSCPFQDYQLWRALVAEQLKKSEESGLPPRKAMYLCGPDDGLHHAPYGDWGGDVHIPYEGTTGADLFILPGWHRFFVEKVKNGGKLRWAVGGKRCHHILLKEDHGELACATRKRIGEWTLYTSTDPYEDCNPDVDPDIVQMLQKRQAVLGADHPSLVKS